jgi:ferritin-like metal-binding protein YciE
MQESTEAVNSYISDMLALESHIDKALKGQLDDLQSYPNVVSELRAILDTVNAHIAALEVLLKKRGGDGAGPMKKASSALLGFAAAAIDIVRKEGLPKNLRDDYDRDGAW